MKEISQHSLFYWPKCLPSFYWFVCFYCMYVYTQVKHTFNALFRHIYRYISLPLSHKCSVLYSCVWASVLCAHTRCRWVSLNEHKLSKNSECEKDTRHPFPLHYDKSSFPFSSHHTQSRSLKIGSLCSF